MADKEIDNLLTLSNTIAFCKKNIGTINDRNDIIDKAIILSHFIDEARLWEKTKIPRTTIRGQNLRASTCEDLKLQSLANLFEKML